MSHLSDSTEEHAGGKSGPASTSPPLEIDSLALLRDLKAFLMEYEHFDDPTTYDLHAIWILASYRVEDFTHYPYLMFLAPYGTGKSRALRLTSLLAYQGKRVTNLTEAGLFHILEEQQPTLCVDEIELMNREGREALLSLLNAGFEPGCPVIRLERQGERWIEREFRVIGFKAFASTEEFALPSTLSRCIVIHMRRTLRRLKTDCDLARDPRVVDLRQRLMDYRTHYLGTPMFEPDFGDLPNSRVEDLYAPLIQIAPDPGTRQRLLARFEEQRLEEREREDLSDEAIIVRAVQGICNDRWEWTTAEIREAIRNQFNIYLETNPLGKKLSALGFRPKKVREQRGWRIRPTQWEALTLRYLSPQTNLIPTPDVRDVRPVRFNERDTTDTTDRTAGMPAPTMEA